MTDKPFKPFWCKWCIFWVTTPEQAEQHKDAKCWERYRDEMPDRKAKTPFGA